MPRFAFLVEAAVMDILEDFEYANGMICSKLFGQLRNASPKVKPVE